MPENRVRPILVGSVALDVLATGRVGAAPRLRWGGVVADFACAIGALGGNPLFISARYEGEMARAVASHLSGYGVTWLPIEKTAPLPVFEARITAQGDVSDENFLGEEAFEALTRDHLQPITPLLAKSCAIVTCTDLSMEALTWLRMEARELGRPFWLLACTASGVWKMVINGEPADVVSLNLQELATIRRAQPLRVGDVIDDVQSIVADHGTALVTLGAAGSLIVHPHTREVLYQPTPSLRGVPLTVGGGDVQFGCLLFHRISGKAWDESLRNSVAGTVSYLEASMAGRDLPYYSLPRSIDLAVGPVNLEEDHELSLLQGSILL